MSWGRQFQAFGGDMRKALSPNFSLDRGANSSASVAVRRVIERGHAVIGCSKDVMSVGAFLASAR